MRFERLGLMRYGALTDRDIVFRDDARLHVVYGPNEAGKSSALAAISDLLFGFEHNVTFAFLHDAPALRVAATIRAQDGSTLSFRRRRGRRATLIRDEDGERPLHDDALAPFVGSLSRSVFERAFGLDSRRLREGARAMLESEGELGSLLFAAASGLLGLSAVKKDLDAEAGAIFARTRSKDRLFYQILDRHEDARRAERESELKASDWKALNKEIDELEEVHAGLSERRAGVRRRLAMLRQLKQIRPIVAEMDREASRLAGFDDIAGLPEGRGAALSALIGDAEAARKALDQAATECGRRREALERIGVDAALLAAGEEITALFAQSGDYANKQRRDLPRIVAERDEYALDIQASARRLGVAEDDLHRLQPSDALMVRIEALTDEGRRLTASAAMLDERIEKERADLDRVEAEQPAGYVSDPKPWRDRFASLAPELRALEDLGGIDAECRLEERRIEEAAAGLTPSVADLDRLARASLPTIETVKRQRDGLNDTGRIVVTKLERLAENDRRLKELAALTAADPAGRLVPTREVVDEARHRRDAAFAALDGMLVVGALVPAGAREGVEDFRRHAGRADALADEAIVAAQRVGDRAARLQQERELEEAGRSLRHEIDEVREAEGAAGSDFRAPFDRLGLEPGTPDAMIEWLGAVGSLLAARQSLLARRGELERLEASARSLRPALEGIADGIGLSAFEAMPGAALARAIDARLLEMAERWSDSRALAARRDDGKRRLDGLSAERTKCAATLLDWRERFGTATNPLALGDSAGVDEVAAALKLWRELPGVRREHENRERRVTGMLRDTAAFEAATARLVGELADDLAGLPADHAVKALSERSERARNADQQRRDAAAALEEADARHRRLKGELEHSEAAREAALAGCPADADPTILAARLEERDGVAGELAKCRRRLADSADGQDEADLRARLAGFDPAGADIEIGDLESEEQRLDGETSEIFARLSLKRGERDRLDLAEGAERAAFEQNAAQTEIVEAARRWTVLRLASTLLSTALERHRESRDEPLMREAGAHFSTLTEGGFVALDRRYDAQDRPELVGVRASGERVAIAAMSDGTRDQLYLALRLAFLADYSSRNEPIPFIGDDLFQTFDDARTAAGISALAGASDRFQPILFAHHRSVADTALAVLGSGADVIEL